ncbi:MAG: hypothetical protein IJM41_06770 [Bacteroidales bacterium]|nr:hypothetical protein [Bacteroidales bacterium]
MSSLSDVTSLRRAGLYNGTSVYELDTPRFTNRFFILSGPGSRRLLSYPEVIGFSCYSALLDETVAAFRHLFPYGPGGDIDILTILRGGLNYPIEEACFQVGIPVSEMHFVSCERIIEDHCIKGLAMKYEKVAPRPGCVLAIGDILATGDTLGLVIKHFAEEFRNGGGSLRRIIFFTVGGTRAFTLMEELAEEFRSYFPGFEGFDCFFYEGAFTVYSDKGASGINVPRIDFGMKGGAISPEFRRFIVDDGDALMEKCIIYDGGARRYEIPLHFEEVMEYWEGILGRADVIDAEAMLHEKLGYEGNPSFEQWKEILHYNELTDDGLEQLWRDELSLKAPDLKALAIRRIEKLNQIKKHYVKD